MKPVCWIAVVALCLPVACSGQSPEAQPTLAEEGAAKSKCPEETHDPVGRPAAPGGAPTVGSEYATISEAVDTVANVAATTTDAQLKKDLEPIVKCLRDMLKNGQICVTDKDIPPGPDGYGGKCLVDNKAGWGADIILLNRRPVHAAAGGAAATATAEKKKAMKKLAGILAHEGVHAGDPNDYSDGKGGQTKKQKKDQEKKAVEVEKKILAKCGYTGNGSKHQFLCWWLFEMCANAQRNPNGKVHSSGCPWVFGHPGRDPATGQAPKTPYFGSASSYATTQEGDPEAGEPNTITVSVPDAPDYQADTDVAFPTILLSYNGVNDEGTRLVVIGADDDDENTVIQMLTFDDDGVLTQTGTAQTVLGRRITGGAAVPESATVYLWDAENAEIVRFEDSDADSIPDDITGVFATATAYPTLNDVASFEAPEEGIVIASHGSGDVLRLKTEQIELVDTDADGAADESTVFLIKDRIEFGPLFLEVPVDGAVAVEVRGTINSHIQVWESNANGDLLAMLGEGDIPYATSSVLIPLGSALVEGDYLVLRDTTLDVDSFPREVESDEE